MSNARNLANLLSDTGNVRTSKLSNAPSPTLGGDLSGTASNAQLGANVVTDVELNSAKLNQTALDVGSAEALALAGL
jgi:hypothetical protein